MTEIQFLNVDLELESKNDITILVADLAKKAEILHFDKDDYRQSVRIAAKEAFKSPEKAIIHLCEIVESSSREALKQWLGCNRRTFDIGFESGKKPKCFNQAINSDTLLRLSAIDAGIEITIYPCK